MKSGIFKNKKVVDKTYRRKSKVAGALTGMITNRGPANVMAEKRDYRYLGDPGPA